MSETLHALIDAFQRGDFPFLTLLGVEPVEFGRGRATIRLRVEERHLRVGGIAHGGLAAGVLDTVVGLATATIAPAGFDLVTIQLNINFIRAAQLGDELRAEGNVIHAGSRTAVVHAELLRDTALIATATATLMFLPPKAVVEEAVAS